MKKKYKGKILKTTSIVLLFTLIIELFAPLSAYALTSGPSTPEVQSFEPAGTSEMVDLFSGDFNYNIPLFELPGPKGGYPFNLSYHSGISMEQEASWVGLGWNINAGAINRDVRGYADDFDGDEIITRQDIKPNFTVGVKGGVNLELFGADFSKVSTKGGVSIGLSVYYNSYKGMGFTFDQGINFSASGDNGTVGLGLNLSLDSQEGAGLRPSLTLSSEARKSAENYNQMSFSVGLNSRRGLTDIGFGISAVSSWAKRGEAAQTKKRNELKACSYFEKMGSGSIGSNSSLTFSATAYSPSIDLPMAGSNASFTFKVGYAEMGVLGAWYLGGFYSEQHLKNANKDIKKKAYGYSNIDSAEKADLMDFNREKDGMVRDQSPNLGIPNMTYDSYSILGQGVGGMFRPYRSNVIALSDPFKKSLMGGGAFGFELGVGYSDIPHFGIDLSVNVAKSWNGPLEGNPTYGRDKNQDDHNDGEAAGVMPEYEKSYFKILGESTTKTSSEMDYIKQDKVVYPDDPDLKNVSTVKSRTARNSVVQSYKNKELASNLFPEYAIKYFTSGAIGSPYKDIMASGTTAVQNFNRSTAKQEHIGAYTILQANGNRYNYALPVYNNKEVNALYSCAQVAKCSGSNPTDGPIPTSDADAKNYHKSGDRTETDQYLNYTQTPKYTTSHLLTSILGPDYVDVDNNGPSNDDFGYWVKFNYVKASDVYKWKAPFNGANLMLGNEYRRQDDKASYVYGEKEIFYLATAETKTHIAVFSLKQRKDGKGVSSQYQVAGTALGEKLYRIDKIQLFEKSNYFNADGTVNSNGKPITTVNFSYSYELCQNVKNFDASVSDADIIGSDDGKLTLKSIWFTYENSSRGELSPYVFNYDNANPDYNKNEQDRWGNYKSYGSGSCDKYDFPYVKQTGNDANNNAKAWNLSSIETPSGSTISVTYQADDYSHVQNKVAGQMFKIAGIGAEVGNNKLYEVNSDIDRRVIFDLETRIHKDDPQLSAKLKRYVDDLVTTEKDENGNKQYQLYYRVRAKLRSNSENLEENITGYATFDPGSITTFGDPASDDSFSQASIVLDPPMVKNSRNEKYHPFSLAAWQYIKVNMPDECAAPGRLSTPVGSQQNAKDKALQLLSAITSIRDLFTNFYARAKRHKWADHIDLSQSWIRLNTPDRIKYGGGLRVQKITISDSWDKDFEGAANENEYGVVYDYTTQMQDENGDLVYNTDGSPAMMSSGVASYEPIIGGDEIPLRYAKMYPEAVPLRTNNNLYFEYPINEGYYPAPTVGYSKVTVRSLATDKRIANASGYEGVPTTGQVVHEFYTAKDFPVLTEETRIDKTPFHLFIPLPFLGEIKIDNMVARQGYKIELNDMHGKPKKITYYGQDIDGKLVNDPLSWVQYNYQYQDNVTINGKRSKKLTNTVKVLTEDGGTPEDREMGVDYDFFTDLRHSYSRSGQGGLSFNSEVLNFTVMVIPAFVPWPNITYNQTEAKLSVANKIIHRAGVQSETLAFDGGVVVSTKNVYYDYQTGRPVLTRVDNNYGDPVFKYNIPAHWIYDGMGPAYKNIGFADNTTNIVDFVGGEELHAVRTDHIDLYTSGDELLMNVSGTNYKGVVIRKANDILGERLRVKIVGASSSLTGACTSLIIRSGRRNMLTTDAGSVVALKDPTSRILTQTCVNSETFTYSPAIDIPDEWIEFWRKQLTPDASTGDFYFATTAVDGWNSYSLSSYPDISDSLKSWWTHVVGNTHELMSIRWGNCQPEVFDDCPGTSCLGTNNINCGHTLHVDFVTEDQDLLTYDCHGLTTPGTHYGSWVCGSGGSAIERFIDSRDSIRRLDSKRFIINFKDGGPPVISNYLYRYQGGDAPCFEAHPNLDCSVTKTYQNIDSVLSFTTSKFKDNWIQNFADVRWSDNESVLFDNANLYASGERGNWNGYESYIYNDVRDKSTNSLSLPADYPNNRRDGSFSSVPVFDWKNPFFTKCFPKWTLSNTITKYNPYGHETENRDVLNNYSAALYSYHGKLAVAVSSNAKMHEIASEGFEEYSTANDVTPINNGTSNFNFVNQMEHYQPFRYDDYDVTFGKGNIAILTSQFGDFNKFYNSTSLSGREIKYEVEAPENGSLKYQSTSGVGTIESANFIVSDPSPSITSTPHEVALKLYVPSPMLEQDAERCWKGKVSIKQQFPEVNTTYSGIEFTDERAHTGSISMKVTATSVFPQFNLKLEGNKKYIFGAWVNNDFTSQLPPNKLDEFITLNNWGIQIGYGPVNTTPTIVATLKPSGEAIEGWRRIEGEFVCPANLKATDVWYIIVKPLDIGGITTIPVYYDDLRLHPFDASIKTFVYDPVKYKLVAELDANNFASLYSYDEQGNLFLVRKETEKGIMTLQETRVNIKHSTE